MSPLFFNWEKYVVSAEKILEPLQLGIGNACEKKAAYVCENTEVAPIGRNIRGPHHLTLRPYGILTFCNNLLNLGNSPQQFLLVNTC